MAVLDLPDETLLEIISLTAREPPSAQVDFARLSLVNHRFYLLTQPSLYRSIEIAGYWEQNYQTSLRALAALAPRPSRARRAPRGFSNRIQRALKHSSETAQTVLLLDLLPHLHVLSITPALPSDLFFVDAVSKGNLPQGLRSLQEIELSCAVDEDPNPWDSNEEAHVSAPGSSSVTELVFILGAIECTSLARTLRLPRALSRFAYDLGGSTTGFASFDAAALWTGLHAYARDSLTYLEITTEISDSSDEPRGELGPLRDFVKLSSIYLPISLLLGAPSDGAAPVKLADLMPPALVSLNLRIDNDWTLEACVDMLVEVLEAKETCTPSLSVLEVGHRAEDPAAERLRVACAAAEVDLRGSR